jgi:ubiquitin-protein ligase E3 C
MYQSVLIDNEFADFFLRKWLGASSFLDELPSLDRELYQGLIFLKNYNGDVEKDLSLTFSISEQLFGVTKNVDLIPNGSAVQVTSENRIRYIYLVAHYKLNLKIARQCSAFFRGLIDLINPVWLKMFNHHELQILLGGKAVPINVPDLRKFTTYGVTKVNNRAYLMTSIQRLFSCGK